MQCVYSMAAAMTSKKLLLLLVSILLTATVWLLLLPDCLIDWPLGTSPAPTRLSNNRTTASTAALQRKAIPIDHRLNHSASIPFEPHIGPGSYDNYLQQTLNVSYLHDALKVLQQHVNYPLLSRGEAHITVITPPEYAQALQSHLTMAEVNEIARRHRIQKSLFQLACVGRARIMRSSQLAGQEQPPYLEVYYLVAEMAPRLHAIRRDVAALFTARGGAADAFDVNAYWPHITLGYSDRDLFAQDGVIKDTSTCWSNITLY